MADPTTTSKDIPFYDYVPESLVEDTNYQVFLRLIGILSGETKTLIEQFPELVDVDNAPERFLPKLSRLIKYKYNFAIDDEIQREVIKRVIEIYRDRGTDDSIIMAATYGADKEWIGSHVFIPGYTLRSLASLYYPGDHLFRYSVSALSGSDTIQDGETSRMGIIQINVGYINDDIRQAIRMVVPAGLKWFINIEHQITGDGTHGSVTYEPYPMLIELGYIIECYLTGNYDYSERSYILSDPVSDDETDWLLSGEPELQYEYMLRFYLGATMLPVSYFNKVVRLSNLKYKYWSLHLSRFTSETNKYEIDSTLLVGKFGDNTSSFSRFMSDSIYDIEYPESRYSQDYEIPPSNVIHDLQYEIDPFEVRIIDLRQRGLSNNAYLDEYFTLSGYRTGEISQFYPDKEILPTDACYTVDKILDKYVGDSYPSCAMADVVIEKI